jgi:hypothetical protein
MRSINCCSAFHRLFSRLVKLVRATCQAVKQGLYRISSSLHIKELIKSLSKPRVVLPIDIQGYSACCRYCSSLTDGCRFPAELLPTIPFFSLQLAAGAAVFDGAGPRSSKVLAENGKKQGKQGRSEPFTRNSLTS